MAEDTQAERFFILLRIFCEQRNESLLEKGSPSNDALPSGIRNFTALLEDQPSCLLGSGRRWV